MDPKQLRVMNHHLGVLFGKNALEPLSLEAAKRLGQDCILREFRLSNQETVLLTDKGWAAFEVISGMLARSPRVPFTEPADSINAFRRLVREFFSEKKVLSSAGELMALVEQRLQSYCHTYWHVTPVHGIELDAVASVSLGCLTLEHPTLKSLKQRGAEFNGPSSIEDMVGSGLCLVGSVYGSEAFARREFKFRSEVVIGVLSAVAAACFTQGANPFRITTEAGTAGMRSPRRGISWHDAYPQVTFSRTVMEHQNLRIDSEMADFLQNAPYVAHALSLTEKSEFTELEQALIRGLFWFSDAQQDTHRVMQLVKYWSCAEVVFSG